MTGGVAASGPCVCGFGGEFFTLEHGQTICTVCGGVVGKGQDILSPEPAGPQKVVLVIDDQGFFRERISSVLKEAGHEVLQATDGLEGIKVIADLFVGTPGSRPVSRLDALILDLVMPGELDGFQTLAVVKKILPDLPVIILTATPPKKEILQKLAQRGAKKYLNKAAENLDSLVLKNIQEV